MEPRFRQVRAIIAINHQVCFFMDQPKDGGQFDLVCDWCTERFGEGQRDEFLPVLDHARWLFNTGFHAIAFSNIDDAMQFKLRWC